MNLRKYGIDIAFLANADESAIACAVSVYLFLV